MTQDRIDPREYLSYDPETGYFKWLRPGRGRHKLDVGSWDAYGYKTVRLAGKSLKLHRAAWLFVHGEWPRGDIDHINGIRHDNRIANLRDVDRKTNLQNRRAANPSKPSRLPLGVHVDHRKAVYSARISIDNVSHVIGYFKTADEASAAYLSAKRSLHVGATAEAA